MDIGIIETPAVETLVTRDISLAAALQASGYRTTGVDLQAEGSWARQVGYFKFAKTPDLDEAVGAFESGAMRVEPKAFHQSLKSLKGYVTGSFRQPRPSEANE